MGLSRLSEKCKNCSLVNSCDHKKMVELGYLELPKNMPDFSQSISQSIALPMLRETMTINDGHGNMVEVYKDDIEKQIKQQFKERFLEF